MMHALETRLRRLEARFAILTIVAFIILIAHKARAEADVGGALTDHSDPGLGRPNSLRLPKPLIDPNGNIVRRNIEIVDTPTLRPGPRIDASLLLPASTADPDRHRRHAGVHPMGVQGSGGV